MRIDCPGSAADAFAFVLEGYIAPRSAWSFAQRSTTV